MQKIRLSVISGKPYGVLSLTMELLVREGMKYSEIISAIKKASAEFCNTDEGKKLLKRNKGFNYMLFETYVPNEICEKYGIKIVRPDENFSVYDELLVKKECLPEDVEFEME